MALATPLPIPRSIPRNHRRALDVLLSTRRDPALLCARVVLGLVMFSHGAQKVLGWFGGGGPGATITSFEQHLGLPSILAVLVMAAEFLGGLGLIAGLLSRVAAGGIVLVMFGAVALVHARLGWFMNWTGTQAGEGIEYHLLAIALGIVVFMRGGGACSVDRVLARRVL